METNSKKHSASPWTPGVCGLLLALGSLVAIGCATAPAHETLKQTPPSKWGRSPKLPAEAEPGFMIAGLNQGAVPQGFTIWPEKENALTSHYFDDGRPSCIVSTAMDSGQATATFQIKEPDGAWHTGHVGGLAADQNSLWIASEKFLYRGLLSSISTKPGGDTFHTQERFSTEAVESVSFCAVFDGLVWAGEFALDTVYPTPESHHLEARDGELRKGWVCGYDAEKGFNHPERVLSIPDRAQGIFATEEYIFLSRSYGRRFRSSVEIYRNPLSEPPHRIAKTQKGVAVPLWFLDGKNHIRTIDLPPMIQNIVVHNEELLVLSESGAKKFRWFGKAPIGRIIHL